MKAEAALDRFVGGRWLWAAAFGLGLAEATVFFVIPDVLLTFVAVRSLRRALFASLWMLAGALTGGAAMYMLGAYAPDAAARLLAHVPFVLPAMAASVPRQLAAEGMAAVFAGPSRWTPYKIYAVTAGAMGLPFVRFMLVSAAARYYRFFAMCIVAWAGSRIARRIRAHGVAVDDAILTAYWAMQYAIYWSALFLLPGIWYWARTPPG